MAPVNLEKVKREGKNLEKEVRERTIGFITGGLGFVAGLAWNEAIKAAIEHIFPLGKDSVSAKFLYAVVVSLVVIVFSVYLARLLRREEPASK